MKKMLLMILSRYLQIFAPCVNPDRKNAFDMKFGAVILCNVTKKMVENNFQHCCYRDDKVTNYVIFFEKLCEKCFFLKLTLCTINS